MSSDQKSSSSGTAGKYPTMGYEDCIFSHGDAKAAAVFTATITKLARMVALKSWPGATVAGQAMERMEEPKLLELGMPLMVYVGKEEYTATIKGEAVALQRDKDVPKDPTNIARDLGIWI